MHVSFLMIDHVQSQSAFLIAAKDIYTCVCALVILFPQSCTNHFEPLGDHIVSQCLNLQS